MIRKWADLGDGRAPYLRRERPSPGAGRKKTSPLRDGNELDFGCDEGALVAALGFCVRACCQLPLVFFVILTNFFRILLTLLVQPFLILFLLLLSFGHDLPLSKKRMCLPTMGCSSSPF